MGCVCSHEDVGVDGGFGEPNDNNFMMKYLKTRR